jgi:hypothetical protein
VSIALRPNIIQPCLLPTCELVDGVREGHRGKREPADHDGEFACATAEQGYQ